MKKDLRGLAIDTAGFAGSISLMNGGESVDCIYLDEGISRAEDLIFSLRDLFIKNLWRTEELDFVAYCSGPGSFTGIRIGAATSLGISKAIGCVCVGITKFEALATAATERKTSEILIEGGNKNIFIGRFLQVAEAKTGNYREFETKKISNLKPSDFGKKSEIILQEYLYRDDFIQKLETQTKIRFTVTSDNVSGLIGISADKKIKEKAGLENIPVYSSSYGS